MFDDPILITFFITFTILIVPFLLHILHLFIPKLSNFISSISSIEWIMRDTFNFSFDNDSSLNISDFGEDLKKHYIKQRYSSNISNELKKDLKNLFENYYLDSKEYSLDELYHFSKLKYSIFYDLVVHNSISKDSASLLNDPVECSSIKHELYKDRFKDDIDFCIEYFTKFYMDNPENDMKILNLFYDILLILRSKTFVGNHDNTTILLNQIDNLKTHLTESKGDKYVHKKDLEFKLIELYKAYLDTPCKESKKYCQTIVVYFYNNINSTLDEFPESFLDTLDLIIKKINTLELKRNSEYVDNLINLNSELDCLIDSDLEIDSLLQQ